MNNFIKKYLFLALALTGAFLFNACIDEDFDQPPTDGIDPGITANTTIKALKEMHNYGQREIFSDTSTIIIGGVIVADDASGNLYKTFVLQDSTAGIHVLINQSDSYVSLPIGREVFIKCKNLSMTDYRNLISLGGNIATNNTQVGIIENDGHIIKGVKKTPPAPKLKTINSLTLNDVGSLIRLNDVEFIRSELSLAYADAANPDADINRTLENCDFEPILVRTSGFASFAGAPLPQGSGSFVGILSVFSSTFQLTVRQLNDITLTGERCNPCPGYVITEVTSLSESYSGGANNTDIALNGWINQPVEGTRVWRYKSVGSNLCAQATSFNDSSPGMEAWLVTPGIKLDAPKVLSFETAQAFWVHDGLSAWISSDFICDATAATWQPLNATIAGQSSASDAFVPSGEIDLSGYTGTVFIGFKYVGDGTGGQTTSYRVDNVIVKNK